MFPYRQGAYDFPVRYFDTDPRTMPLGQLLSWVGVGIGERWKQATTGAGVNRTAYTLLTAVADQDGITQREIARHSRLSPATLTPAVDALEGDGLLRRERDATDRRQIRLHLTDRGRARLDEVRTAIRTSLGPLFPEVTEAEQALIRNYLVTLLGNLHHEDGGR